jgi:hypothetical protein
MALIPFSPRARGSQSVLQLRSHQRKRVNALDAFKVVAARHPQTFLNALCRKRKHFFQFRVSRLIVAQR